MRLLASVACLAGATLAVPAVAHAQLKDPAPSKIAVGSVELAPVFELRVRGETRRAPPDLGGLDGYGRATPRVASQWDVASRARLGLAAERGPLHARIVLQDARALGTPAPTAAMPTSSGIAELAPYEAWGEARSESDRPTFLRVGRQPVTWGEGRLLGIADFAPRGRAIDAARAGASFGGFDAELLAALLDAPRPLGTPLGDTAGPRRSGTQLYGALLRRPVVPWLSVEAYGLVRVARGSALDLDGSRFAAAHVTGETYTGALRLSGDTEGLTYGVEGNYQLGRAPALASGARRIAAWAATAHVEKTLPLVKLRPTLRALASYASGDDGGSGAYRQFDPLLGDPQRFHGPMDVFALSNLIDVGGGVSVVPFRETTVSVLYRYARLASARGEWIGGYLTALGRGDGRSAALGHELSGAVGWKPWAPLELSAAYAGLVLGDGAEAVMAQRARGAIRADGTFHVAPIAHYAYAQASLRF